LNNELRSGRRGRRFKSGHLDQKLQVDGMTARRGGHAIDHLLATRWRATPSVTSVTDVRDRRLCAACDGEDRQGMPPRRGIGLRGLNGVLARGSAPTRRACWPRQASTGVLRDRQRRHRHQLEDCPGHDPGGEWAVAAEGGRSGACGGPVPGCAPRRVGDLVIAVGELTVVAGRRRC